MSAAAVVVAAVLWASASRALAQQRAQTDGRALDANPQVGSGGHNNIQNQIDYAARNAIVTGDVAGGSQFRGRINYTAPQSFRGRLGSDANFRFYAESLPSALPLTGTPAGYGATPIQVYRSQAGATLGSLSVSRDPFTAQGYAGGSAVLRLNDIGNASAYQNLGGAAPLRQSAAALAVMPTANGQLLEVSASPLLGVRHQRVAPSDSTPAADANPALRGQPSPAVDLRFDSQYRNPLLNPQDAAGDDTWATLGSVIRGWSPGLELSMQDTARLDNARIGEQAQRLDQRIARLEEAMLNPLGTRNAQPGDDVYADLLARVRAQTSSQVSLTTPQGGSANAKPGATSPSHLPSLEVPTLEQLRVAEEARREAERRMLEARGIMRERLRDRAADQAQDTDQGQGPGGGATDAQQTPEDVRDAEINARADALTSLMDKLAYDLPRLTTLAGERDNRINELMRAAEEDLQRGRFFDAEGKYRETVRMAPAQPLARVGLVHAQLSAGLVRSSAVNLRNVLQQHPELIATRYDPKLLPPQDRLDFVHAELQKAIESADSGGAALLTAYLGYQLDSVPLIRYGLAMLEVRAPQDPLIPLLRRIWLDETRPAGAAGRAPAQDK